MHVCKKAEEEAKEFGADIFLFAFLCICVCVMQPMMPTSELVIPPLSPGIRTFILLLLLLFLPSSAFPFSRRQTEKAKKQEWDQMDAAMAWMGEKEVEEMCCQQWIARITNPRF